MALDPVPWFIGGAAEHSAEAARNIAWNATQGRTGVATTGSLAVTALSTPGGGVRVAPGGAAIESTYAGATQQSYTVRNDATETVAIPANNTASERHQRVAIYIKDVQYAGSAPADPVNGPYTDWYVGSTWPTWPHVKLAFIRVPPYTSVITNSMISDERELLNPRRSEVVHARPRVASESSGQANLTAREPAGEYFPGGAGFANEFTVTVPEWCTRIVVDASWMAVRYAGGVNAWGAYWVEFGDEYRGANGWPGNQQWEFATQKFQFDSAAAGNTSRAHWGLMDAVYMPAKLRGKEVTFVFKAGLNPSAATNGVRMDAMSGLGMRVTFAEQIQDWDTL